MHDPNSIDAALDALLTSGWTETPEAETAPVAAPVDKIVHDVTLLPRVTTSVTDLGQVEPDQDTTATDREDDGGASLLNIGLLTDLATRRRTPDQAATSADVSMDELQGALATALQDADPRDLAKAMGLQVTATQLKAGAVFGALLHTLLQDIRLGRVKAEHQIKLMELLAKVGKLEPKEVAGASAGGGFSLNINIGAAAPQTVTIDAAS